MEGMRALYNANIIGQPNQTYTIYCDNSSVVRTLNEWGPKRTLDEWKDKAYAGEFINMLQFIDGWRKVSPLNIVWIQGHSGLKYNDYVDALATKYRT